MIIKVDHITEVIKGSSVFEKRLKMIEEGYRQKFEELKLQNISCKQKYMKRKLEFHDMYFYERETSIPIEVIAYTEVNAGYAYIVDKNRIDISVKNIESVANIMKYLGAKVIEDNKSYNIRGVFDKQDIVVNLLRTENVCTRYLDDEGMGCITLLMDSIQKVGEKLDKNAINHSEVCNIEVDGKHLYIMFVSSENNELIIELISNRR